MRVSRSRSGTRDPFASNPGGILKSRIHKRTCRVACRGAVSNPYTQSYPQRQLSTAAVDTAKAICYCSTRVATRLNLRRGFNRIYLVLTILWCLWILWWPVKSRNEAYSGAFSRAYTSFDLCRDIPGGSHEYCVKTREAALAEAKRDTLDKNPYLWASGGFNASLLLFPVFMVVPPAIIYGLLFGLAKLGLWIIDGFKT